MAEMLPEGMEVLNIEYWDDDAEQIYDIGWVSKIPTLKELSRNGMI